MKLAFIVLSLPKQLTLQPLSDLQDPLLLELGISLGRRAYLIQGLDLNPVLLPQRLRLSFKASQLPLQPIVF